jgi:Flp pilus assembly protein TadG
MRRIDMIEAIGRAAIDWRGAAKDRRGVAAVEFAILVPVLILLVLATADVGLAAYADIQVQSAAEAGVGYAFLHGYDSTAISSAVTGADALSGLSATPAPAQFCGCPGSTGVTATTCGSSCGNGNNAGTYVKASATAVYHTLISYPIIPNKYTFASTSTVRIK